MKKYKAIVIFLMLANSITMNLSAHSIFFNLFCCTTVATAIQPEPPITLRPDQGFDIHRFIRGQRSQDKANIQALRLIATIEYEDLIDQKKYAELEKVVCEKSLGLNPQRFNYFQHISYRQEQLVQNYKVYLDSNEDSPKSKNSNKKR